MTRTGTTWRLRLAVAALLASTLPLACERKVERFESEPAPVNWQAALPPACDKDVTELLDGLKVGDSVHGVTVAAIGKPNAEGVIPIVFVSDGAAIMLVVAVKSEQSPPPPAVTSKYSVFYQPFHGLPRLSSDQMGKLMNEVVERLKRTEDKVPAPAGLKHLPMPGQPA